MRKLLTGIFMLFSTSCFAAPFLVCDAPPAGETVDSYQIIEGANTITTLAPLHYDLTSVTSGVHNVTVKACNIWGCSVATPFSYTKGVPGGVSGLRLSGN